MQVEVLYRPSYAVAQIQLAAGEQLRAEPGCMVGMTSNLKLESKMQGGFFNALKNAALGGESLFQTTYTAEGGPGQILVAPGAPGDIMVIELVNQSIVVQSGSWLAGSQTLQMNTKFGGAKSFFGGEGLFMLNLTGTGTLVVSSFGAIHKVTLEPGQDYVVDTGHIVAFDASTSYEIQKAAKGLFNSVASGEGLVCKFKGPGDVYLQTRNLQAFVQAMTPFLPKPAPAGG